MANEKSGEKFATLLRKAATGIENLQVQLSLGEAEAADKYEEVKKKFNSFLHNAKAKIGTQSRRAANDLRAEVDELQVQLSLGKADSRDKFEEQKKKISKSMDKLERKIKSAEKASGFEEELLHEIETMRIKLEVIRIHYALGQMEALEEFENKKHDLSEMLAKTKAKVAVKKEEFAKKRQRRYAEIRESYKHLKKAFVKA
ncbi:MAG: hypothetical protein HY064_17430 [Bacteroidetes bacterium]|nr:hypothetical protein [Bacteroidota bacterium]